MEEEYLLTFEIDKSNEYDELFIHTNQQGLKYLIERLQNFAKWAEEDKSDHIHLFTKEWGDGELSSESQGYNVVNHVKIYCHK